MAALLGCLPISLPAPAEAWLKAWLEEQANHLKSYGTRLQELEVAIGELTEVRKEVEHQLDEEVDRYGRESNDKVAQWIKGVKEATSEYEDLKKDPRHERAVFNLFSTGRLPKPGIRYRLSRKAFDITTKVNGLQKAKPDTFSYWSGPPSMAAFFSNIGYESFESRDKTMKKIMEALEKASASMIGVSGLSGVGKTTLVKEVAKKGLQDKMFDMVTMANVTRNPDIRKIQGQIADMLGMKLEEESDVARAARIRKRLKSEKKKTLIILDDLWAKLDLNMLGIPYENDADVEGQKNLKEGKSSGTRDEKEKTEPDASNKKTKDDVTLGRDKWSPNKEKTEPNASNKKAKGKETLSRNKGCKVLLISESKRVLSSQMDGKDNLIFTVEVLKEKEAEKLFKKMAGVDRASSGFEKLAAQIAQKCEGLPVSVVTISRALRNESRSVWEDAYQQLKMRRLIGAPEFSTRLSYDLLENEELKYTFLLCARMGHDALIMDLVRYCIGLGFLQGIYTAQEARGRVYALVRKLKESALLSDSYTSDHFTMQDIVRGAALSIASEEKHVFTMTKEKLDEWPNEDRLERYTVISLQHCDIIGGFPDSINCPRLRVFHIDNNDPHLTIPENFFQEMNELRVLILTGFHLSPLPSSIGCLTKLRMLCLEQCMLGEGLSIIGELKNLRILSLSRSDIEKLPTELKNLARLQILDISNCYRLREIPSHVISSLVKLEELYMRNNLIQWKVGGQSSENASLLELKHLNQLTTLDIQIPIVAHLPKDFFFGKLSIYKIAIGDLSAYIERDFKMLKKHEALRFLSLQLKDGSIHSQKGIKMLFERVEDLWLGELKDVQDIFGELNLKGFQHLKHLSVVWNSSIECIINSRGKQIPEKAFSKLESMYLYKLDKVKHICIAKILPIQSHDQLTFHSFCKLKTIKIKMCGLLKNVFRSSMVGFLVALETIEVSECNSLEKIVADETQSNKEIEFPQLRSLTLQSLSRFIGFYPDLLDSILLPLFNGKVKVPKLERMELSSIKIRNLCSNQPLPNLVHLQLNDCGDLESLLSFSVAKSLVNLQSLFVSECENVTSIFQSSVAEIVVSVD